MSKGSMKLTVGDKILLLLLDYTRYRGELQAPIDVTQDGIADKLGIIRSAVPRAVGGLIDRDLVEEYLAHIEGLARRRKVYMLTERGVIKAREMFDEIGTVEVEVHDDGGTRKESVSALLNTRTITLDSLSGTLSSRRIDLRKGHMDVQDSRQTSYTHSLSPPEIFLDREREMEELTLAIRSPKRKVTVVYGIAGVGKTTLAWRISQVFGGEMNIFYMDLKEWTSLNYLLTEMAGFLARAGWSHLKEYMDTNKEDIESCCDLLKNLPREVPALFILDDLHRAPKEINMFLASLKDRLPFMRQVNLVVLSRTRADFYDIRDVRISGIVGEIELLGFDRETSRKFLLERGFPREEVDEIIDRTGGHPLALVLVEKEGYDVDISDFDEFLRKEIFSRLNNVDNFALAIISLSRLQLRDEEMIASKCCDQGSLKRLCDQRLIFYTPSGYIVHDLVRDQAVSNLTTKEKEKAHKAIASMFHEKLSSQGFYQDIGKDVPPAPFMLEDMKGLGPAPLYVSEEVHHLVSGGMMDDALKLVVRAVLQIPSKDLLDEVQDHMPGRTSGNGVPDLFYKAVLHIHKGEYEKSLKGLERIAGLTAKGDLDSACIICSTLWIPWVIERVRGPSEALTVLNRTEEGIDRRLLYYFLTYRAGLMYKLGDHKGSSEVYARFLDSVLNNPEFPIQLKETIGESLTKAKEGGIQKATDSFQKIMELTRLNRDLIREEMPFVDVDHHLLSAIYSVFYGRNISKR